MEEYLKRFGRALQHGGGLFDIRGKESCRDPTEEERKRFEQTNTNPIVKKDLSALVTDRTTNRAKNAILVDDNLSGYGVDKQEGIGLSSLGVNRPGALIQNFFGGRMTDYKHVRKPTVACAHAPYLLGLLH